MRPLRTRIRPDNIPNEQRVVRGSAGRLVYLALLGVFALVVANYLFGDLIILHADGLVLRDQNVVATTYIARVERIDVKEGQSVAKGAPLLKLQSLDILERLADLSTKRAELAAKVADFKIRAERTEQLLPLAERRETEAARVIKQFDTMAKDGFVRSVPYAEALSSNYDARRDHVSLSAESRVLKDELNALTAALSDAEAALHDLQASYAGGLVRASVGGSIGATVPSVGDVYRPGDQLLSIYSGEPYVLVYLPRRYLFAIYVGMRLHVTDGRRTANAVVAEILPLTATLPKEFQNTFQPLNRNQLAKIRLSRKASFPLNQKVSVTRAGF
jgi:multidrug resistance efflux pump